MIWMLIITDEPSRGGGVSIMSQFMSKLSDASFLTPRNDSSQYWERLTLMSNCS